MSIFPVSEITGLRVSCMETYRIFKVLKLKDNSDKPGRRKLVVPDVSREPSLVPPTDCTAMSGGTPLFRDL